MPAEDHDRHGNPFTHGWVPGNPVLRGETRTPDDTVLVEPGQPVHRDTLSHRDRVAQGLAGDTPDPGYDPDADDLAPGEESHP